MCATSGGAGHHYRYATRNKVFSSCPQTVIEARKMDAEMSEHVTRVLLEPGIIVHELERFRAEGPTEADLASVDRVLADVRRQQDNLARHLALFADFEAAAPVVRQLEALREQI